MTGRARGRGRCKLQPEPEAPGTVQPTQLSKPLPEVAATSCTAGKLVLEQVTELQTAAAKEPPPEVHAGGRGVYRGGGRERSLCADVPLMGMRRMSLQDKHRRMPYEKYIDFAYKDKERDPHGNTGNKSTVVTNHFKVTLPCDFRIWQYHVNFHPPVENVRVKFALIASLEITIGAVKCFDGGILYLCRLLQNEVTECFAVRTYDSAVIKVEIKRVCEVFSNTPQYLQISNLLFKKVQMALGMKQIRNHCFNPALSVKIPKHKLEVMPGFITSILRYEAGNLLVVDTIHKVLRIDTFLDCLYNLYNSMDIKDLKAFQTAALKSFAGSIVMTRHNNKTYRVDDIDWDGRPSSTFEKNGTQITYIDYYKQHWNIDIMDENQPLLVTKPTEKDRNRGETKNLFLLPELCTITGLSDDARADFNVMKDLAVHTRLNPNQRLTIMEDFLKQVNTNDSVKKILNPWQTFIDCEALRVPARQLPAEKLVMRSKRGDVTHLTYNIREADWSREIRNACLLNPVHVTAWLLIYPQKLSGPSNELAEVLHLVGNGIGMRISEPTRVELNTDRNEAYLQGIRQNLNQRIQIVVVVVHNNKKDRYDAIKKCCCIDSPVPSQVVMAKTLAKQQSLMSIATKIAIQMNCKIGGEVWGVEIPVKGLMIIGIDSYHDSANKGQSVGALVATLNKECTRYYSMTEYHPRGSDALNGLTALLAVTMRKYHEANGALPQKFVFYRDGIGDGQLDFVFKHECEQVNEAFSTVGGEGYVPKYAYVIVKKRINTRLFAPEQNRMVNPQSGTIVDSDITKPEWYDFFLVSQSVRQGTVCPTSYNVIYDTSGLQADHMQRLTYKLTHMYFNWQGTVRVPAPCQYAHKLAFLQGQSLHRQFSAHLADKLFYL